jgi:hypothetical protein
MLCARADVTGPVVSNAVDIFDGTSGLWTTAALSEVRVLLAATSLPSQGLAIFAGGQTNGAYFILFLELLILQDGVMRESGKACVAWNEASFEVLEMNADALRMSRWCEQCRGHFQYIQQSLVHCCSQRGKKLSRSDVTAEPRIGHIRRWPGERYACFFLFRVVDIARWWDVEFGLEEGHVLRGMRRALKCWR